MYAIASREDLKGEKPEGAFNQKATRISRSSTIMEFEFNGSPTNDNEDTPTFSWSANPKYAALPHDGLPDVYNFSWITLNDTVDRCNSFDMDECYKKQFCGYCISSKKCMAGVENGPFNDKCEEDQWSYQNDNNLIYIISLSAIAVIVICGGVLLALYFRKRSTVPDLAENPLIDDALIKNN